jgi:DNA polymerase V
MRRLEKIYTVLQDEQISANLRAILESSGMNQIDFATLLSIKPQNLNGYLWNRDGRKAANLYSKLVEIGINGNWYLTGKGDIYAEGGAARNQDQALEEEARKIQTMFDRGLIKINLAQESAPSGPKSHAIESQTYQGKPIPQEMAQTIPVFTCGIAAGKPGESSCAIEEYITISACRVKHPKDTYAVKAHGDSMKDVGILEGDLLIVDRAIEPLNNHIVIASIDNELTVKRLRAKKGAVSLVPENSNYKPIEITPEMDFRTLGVVTYVIRKTG